jgi:hypothetical protein
VQMWGDSADQSEGGEVVPSIDHYKYECVSNSLIHR